MIRTDYSYEVHLEDGGKYAINRFAASHECNYICHALGLSPLEADTDALLSPILDLDAPL